MMRAARYRRPSKENDISLVFGVKATLVIRFHYKKNVKAMSF
jgi:hypothetical protein